MQFLLGLPDKRANEGHAAQSQKKVDQSPDIFHLVAPHRQDSLKEDVGQN